MTQTLDQLFEQNEYYPYYERAYELLSKHYLEGDLKETYHFQEGEFTVTFFCRAREKQVPNVLRHTVGIECKLGREYLFSFLLWDVWYQPLYAYTAIIGEKGAEECNLKQLTMVKDLISLTKKMYREHKKAKRMHLKNTDTLRYKLEKGAAKGKIKSVIK